MLLCDIHLCNPNLLVSHWKEFTLTKHNRRVLNRRGKWTSLPVWDDVELTYENGDFLNAHLVDWLEHPFDVDELSRLRNIFNKMESMSNMEPYEEHLNICHTSWDKCYNLRLELYELEQDLEDNE